MKSTLITVQEEGDEFSYEAGVGGENYLLCDDLPFPRWRGVSVTVSILGGVSIIVPAVVRRTLTMEARDMVMPSSLVMSLEQDIVTLSTLLSTVMRYMWIRKVTL